MIPVLYCLLQLMRNRQTWFAHQLNHDFSSQMNLSLWKPGGVQNSVGSFLNGRVAIGKVSREPLGRCSQYGRPLVAVAAKQSSWEAGSKSGFDIPGLAEFAAGVSIIMDQVSVTGTKTQAMMSILSCESRLERGRSTYRHRATRIPCWSCLMSLILIMTVNCRHLRFVRRSNQGKLTSQKSRQASLSKVDTPVITFDDFYLPILVPSNFIKHITSWPSMVNRCFLSY